ncbi:unnamed protein product [Amoebophrya sp. A120]|nr:unnamed protein product [Amoebophrya sp. A120]|eukprot:GSA120T00025043001.1
MAAPSQASVQLPSSAYVDFVEKHFCKRLFKLEDKYNAWFAHDAQAQAAAIDQEPAKSAQVLEQDAALADEVRQLRGFWSIHRSCIGSAEAGHFCYRVDEDFVRLEQEKCNFYCWFPPVQLLADSDSEDSTPAGADHEPALPDHAPAENLLEEVADISTAADDASAHAAKKSVRKEYPERGVMEHWRCSRENPDAPGVWACTHNVHPLSFESTGDAYITNCSSTPLRSRAEKKLSCRLHSLSLSITQEQLRMWVAAVRRNFAAQKHGAFLPNFPDELFRKIHAFLEPLSTCVMNRDYLAALAVKKRRRDVESLLNLAMMQSNIDAMCDPPRCWKGSQMKGGLFWVSDDVGLEGQFWKPAVGINGSMLVVELGDKVIKVEGDRTDNMWPASWEEEILGSAAWKQELAKDRLVPRATRTRPNLDAIYRDVFERIMRDYFGKKGWDFQYWHDYRRGERFYDGQECASGIEFRITYLGS